MLNNLKMDNNANYTMSFNLDCGGLTSHQEDVDGYERRKLEPFDNNSIEEE